MKQVTVNFLVADDIAESSLVSALNVLVNEASLPKGMLQDFEERTLNAVSEITLGHKIELPQGTYVATPVAGWHHPTCQSEFGEGACNCGPVTTPAPEGFVHIPDEKYRERMAQYAREDAEAVLRSVGNEDLFKDLRAQLARGQEIILERIVEHIKEATPKSLQEAQRLAEGLKTTLAT